MKVLEVYGSGYDADESQQKASLKLDQDSNTLYEDRALVSLQELKGIIDCFNENRPSLTSQSDNTPTTNGQEEGLRDKPIFTLLEFIKDCLTDLQLILLNKK